LEVDRGEAPSPKESPVALRPGIVDWHAFEAPFLAVAAIEARIEEGERTTDLN